MAYDHKGDEPRVLVIGGGPAGLLTAHALQVQGIKVTVYEQDASLEARPRDWNFGIYWAQVPLAECLPSHLRKEVEDAQVDDHRAGADEIMPLRNAETGELIMALPIPYNIRLARKRFLRLLSRELDIRYSKKISSISSDGKLATTTFFDGTTSSGDLIVGAEGAHSVVRDFLVGPESAKLTPLPLSASVTMAKLSHSAATKFKQDYASRFMVLFHPLGYSQWVGLHEAHAPLEPGQWTFMMIQTWNSDHHASALSGKDSDEILRDMKRRVTEVPFDEGIREMWQSLPEGTKCWHSQLSHWLPPEEGWDNRSGTVTLVGDAAHPMTFHRGQGLNNSIHDVASLARHIKTQGLGKQAIDRYEAEMIPRAREAVQGSTENSLMNHDWDQLRQSPLFKMGLKAKQEES